MEGLPRLDMTFTRTKHKERLPHTTRERDKPVFGGNSKGNRALLDSVLEGLDKSHACLRPVDKLFWQFGVLEQLTKVDTPMASMLQEVYNVLCMAVYDCSSSDDNKPEPVRGKEFSHLLRKIDNSILEMDLANATIQFKQTALHKQKVQRVQELRMELENSNARQTELQLQLIAEKKAVEEEEKLYEQLLRDEAALEIKITTTKDNYVDAKAICAQISLKASAVQEECQNAMKIIHERELKDKMHLAIHTNVQELQQEHSKLLVKYQNYEKEIQTLQTQLESDQTKVLEKNEELRLAELEKLELVDGTLDLQRSHTPRPNWDGVFHFLPEISYVDPKHHVTWDAKTLILSNKRGIVGRSQRFVNEMCHWLQRIQGDCGVSLELARLVNQTEEARLELNSLQSQLEFAERKEKRNMKKAAQNLPNGTKADVNKPKVTFVSAVRRVSAAILHPTFIPTEVPSSTAPPPKDYILALGSTPEVPQFLRHTGKVRNRHISKTELERVIRTVWTGKRAKEAHMGNHIALDDFLYEVLKTKFGIQTVVAEWGYNILQSAKKFSWDSEVELFLLSLTGAVSEAIYDDQENMIDACRALLLRLNESYIDTEWKTEPKRVFIKDALLTLHNFFPLKTPLQLKSIEKALLYERLKPRDNIPMSLNEAMVLIEDLLPTKPKIKRGYFIKTLRTQHCKEIKDYLALLERKLREADIHNSGRVEIEKIRKAMQSLDPNVTSEWIGECILRGIPKRLVGHVDLSSVVEYRCFLKNSISQCMMQQESHESGAMRTLLTASSMNSMYVETPVVQRRLAPPLEPAVRAWPASVHSDPDIEQLDADGLY
ncbi:hypothetical protein THRCLA_02816, partial [Thraustotheca clavata]